MDGSKVFTMGIVHDATWTFEDSARAVCYDFYVLDELLVDVVFRNDLFGLNVFVFPCPRFSVALEIYALYSPQPTAHST